MDGSSTQTINFSLRQNKSIERAITFDSLVLAREFIGAQVVYVGLGSLWFQDFRIAQRLFNPQKMVTIEGDPAIYKRVEFNQPYRTIESYEGATNAAVPHLLERRDLNTIPWIVWLDYDREIVEERLNELEELIVGLVDGSVLITTFNAKPDNYGKSPEERQETLERLVGTEILGEVVDDEELLGDRFTRTLVRCVSDYMKSTAVRRGRGAPFVPGIELVYRDSTPMATVGGFLPTAEDASAAAALVDSDQWIGREPSVIATYPLTRREIEALCKLLPADSPLTPNDLIGSGFALDEEQLAFFSRHYLRYPSFAEIV